MRILEKIANLSNISIQRATLNDLPTIASLMHEAFVEYKSAYTDEAFAATTPTSHELVQRIAEGPIWVAVDDDALLGTVSVVARAEEVYIRGMAVGPQARGRQLGKLLLKTVEDFALAHGHKRLVLSTTPFLTRAIRLYERSGFRRTADAPHDLFGTPLFTMVKVILDDN